MKNSDYTARLGKIPLCKGSRDKVNKLLAYMQKNSNDVQFEMDQKGYWWDAVFYEEAEACDFFWFVAKSKNWNAIKNDDQITHTPFRAVYNKFREECWLTDKLTEKDFFVSIWMPDFL